MSDEKKELHLPFEYPDVKRSDQTMDYHGTKVPDPYSWLEDPDAEEVKDFVTAQNKLSAPYMEGTEVRDLYKDRMTELWNYEKVGAPFKKGERYFQYQNSGLLNQYVLYTADKLLGKDTEWKIFIDPNTWSEDGTISLKETSFTKDGTLMAYSKSISGSDWVSIHFMEVETKRMLPDVLEKCKFTCLTWLGNEGFFYARYPEQVGKRDGTETTKNEYHTAYYHKLGTAQDKDVLVAQFKDNPQWMSGVNVSYDMETVMLEISESCEPVNKLWLAPSNCDLGNVNWLKLVDTFDAQYQFIWKEKNTYYFLTNDKAPRYKVTSCTVDFEEEDFKAEWADVIPQHDINVLESCKHCCGHLIVKYMEHCKNVVQIHDLGTGKFIRKLALGIGTCLSMSCRPLDPELFIKMTNFLSPGVIYETDVIKGELSTWYVTQVKGVDFDQFASKQVFFDSADGKAKIPMFIVHRKDLELTGKNPTLMYGYGGFSISLTPAFSIGNLLFVHNFRGVYCLVNIRGGGEYGEDWHKAGCLFNMQNSYDDFQDAAKYMVEEKYTNPDKIVIRGGSNGGTLVTACANQAPELYGAVIAAVPVTDMIQFHKWTIGHAWVSDFGNPDTKEDFESIMKWSPLHNCQNVQLNADNHFPAMIVLTADHDDRVVPAHSLKYIAELQHCLGKKVDSPLFIRVECKAGHGAGKPTAKIIEEYADQFAFVSRALGFEWYKD